MPTTQCTTDATKYQGYPKNALFWKFYVDGSSNIHGAEAGIVLQTLDEPILNHALKLRFKASNNEVEYKALLTGLKVTEEL